MIIKLLNNFRYKYVIIICIYKYNLSICIEEDKDKHFYTCITKVVLVILFSFYGN